MSMKKMLAVVAAASLVAVAAPAFAANPFSDVPMNHWAYDAVEQLSAKGVFDGYPNGTFKGNSPMSRYEFAMVVARMMANGGIGGADAEKLKALVVEFAPELEALGVKVDGFDGRLTALEKGVGGFRISGQMRYDYNAFDNPIVDAKGNEHYNTHEWEFDRARLFIHKDLSDKVSWDMRWHNDAIDRWWLTAKDFAGVEGLTATLGSFLSDWELDDNLHESNAIWDDDASFYDTTVRGADLKYSRGGITVEGFYATELKGGAKGIYTSYEDGNSGEFYGARIKYAAEKFFVSANGYWFNYKDSAATVIDGTNYAAYWFALGFKPFKGVGLNGVFYTEDITSVGGADPKDDSPNAWKVVLALDEDLLKFTNLRFEYGQYDAGWVQQTAAGLFTIDSTDPNVNEVGNENVALAEDMDFLKVSAIQNWGPKFSTYERYGQYDQDTAGKAKEWTVGIGYQYTPNLAFYLDYTDFDGRMNKESGAVDEDYDNNLIRFRTFLNF